MTDARPYKRRKTTQEVPEDTENLHRSTQKLVLEQIDLDVGIRRRLEETVNSRLTWAYQLQQALRAGNVSQAFLNDDAFDYQAIAFEALHAAEAPILPVLSHEALPPRAVQLGRSIPDTPPLGSVAASPVLDALPPSRTSSRSTRTRGQPAAPRLPAKKFMYLRNTAFNPPTLAKLVCSDCARSDMTNLQGLYNHYRLRHKREFGSHDECIRASAVKVLPEEEAWVIENGIELPGVNLPSLRSLFELAVGAEKESEDHSPSPAPYVEGSGPANAVAESTHLSRTLGHHIDTPALAPFLGREVKRRTIAVHREDVDVDVENVPSSGLRGWRKPYMHRNKAVPALDVASPEPRPEHEPPNPPLPTTDSVELQVASSLPATGSRFHFTARVTIGDRSLWIPPRGRDSVPEGHTHRCMVYVDSPSYSLHASAFISQMSVRSLTEPPPSTLTEPVVVSTYPFAATLTTDKPFLAQVTLSVVGERNPDIVVQHWVELDPFKHEKSVLGDEQVLDVELDRSTQYHAPLSHINPSDVLNASRQRAAIEQSVKVSADEVPPYARLLKSLLPRFPMTSRDSKGISTSHLPYKLVPSTQALYSLVVGRRKAIERARAQALCDAYAKARAALPPEELFKHLELSITDVYIWLEDGGHFLRPAPVQPSSTTLEGKKSDASGVQQSDGRFCPVCGMNLGLHPQVKAENGLLQPPPCPYAPPAPRLLVLDPFQSMTISENLPAAPRAALREWRYPTQEILHTVDPRLIDATSRISENLLLQQPLAIAGSGTLALATRAFVRHLLNRAIRVAYGDLTGALGSGAGLHGQQLLTPGHILRAMDSEVAMKIVGSVLGSVRSCPVAAATLQSERDGGVAIKQELEE